MGDPTFHGTQQAANASLPGKWFEAQFGQLVQNVHPPLCSNDLPGRAASRIHRPARVHAPFGDRGVP
ncbi:hypothetical protein [Amycolatopsis mediterranei]|uniref:hypothetical protein n=1 Tax=Amycolatopsis mediterranei TaxID=33910 RepID=UPI00049F5B53|nr:hypothetical protein [Amycolatopsis mediterranei]KDO12540.1 hypothetical protein DV26_01045 [Amycolatopsis mediterranei]KDU88624.1 hypothetical protein DV36_28840 [Amycolatopsis mediterranei]